MKTYENICAVNSFGSAIVKQYSSNKLILLFWSCAKEMKAVFDKFVLGCASRELKYRESVVISCLSFV